MNDNVKHQNKEIKTESNSTEFQAEELDKRYEMYGPTTTNSKPRKIWIVKAIFIIFLVKL